MGGPGVGFVEPDIQTQPRPRAPVFASLDLRERIGRPGDPAMVRRREEDGGRRAAAVEGEENHYCQLRCQ